MNTLRITLRQHTPLIHFQQDQDGATLRASEVKPKLDKYLIQKYGTDNYEIISDDDFDNVAAIYDDKNTGLKFDQLSIEQQEFEVGKYLVSKNSWIYGSGNHLALNYKIKIIAGEKNESIRLSSRVVNREGIERYYSEDFPMVLSNMGGKDTKEELLNFSFRNSVDIIIISKDCQLLKYLSDCISLFFMKTNFGQRNSKGFGSFTVIGTELNGDPFPVDIREPRACYMEFSYNTRDELLFQNKLFQTIDFYWKCLKSGINYTMNGQYPNRYIKAFLWKYLNEKGETWEKRIIKQHFRLTTGSERLENNNSVSFARALLGCPDKFEYKNMNSIVSIKHDEDRGSHLYIDRIPSPIIFKPIVRNDDNGNRYVRVYILINDKGINELRERNNLKFIFECNNNSLNIEVKPNVVTLDDLIRNYHDSFKKNEYIVNLFNNDDEYDDFIYKNGLEDKIWFIPLDFRWNKIINTPIILNNK